MAQAQRRMYEYASLTEIHDWSELAHSDPLFDVLLLLDSAQGKALDCGPLAMKPIPGPYDSALPLTLAVDADPQAIRIHGSIRRLVDDTASDRTDFGRFLPVPRAIDAGSQTAGCSVIA